MGRYTKAEILARTLPIALPTLGWAAFGMWLELVAARSGYGEVHLCTVVACGACALLASVGAVGAVRLARLRKASWLGHVGFALLAIVGGYLLAPLTANVWVPPAMMRATEDWPAGAVVLLLLVDIPAFRIGWTSAVLAIALAYTVGVGKEWRPASRPIEHE